jgi:hypothetical protein
MIVAGVGAAVVVHQRTLLREVEAVLEVGESSMESPGLHVVVYQCKVLVFGIDLCDNRLPVGFQLCASLFLFYFICCYLMSSTIMELDGSLATLYMCTA